VLVRLVSQNPALMKIFVTVCVHTSIITIIQLASKIVAFCCVFQLSEQDFVRTDLD